MASKIFTLGDQYERRDGTIVRATYVSRYCRAVEFSDGRSRSFMGAHPRGASKYDIIAGAKSR